MKVQEIKIDINKLNEDELDALRKITYRYGLMEETKLINNRIIEIK